MKSKIEILIATDVVADARLVKELLNDEFDNIATSTDQKMAVTDFENLHPDVLVLAFNRLEKAERYYLGLYRLSKNIHAIPHRTLILCNKDDLKRVYALCRSDYFDNYIPFWPFPEDVMRLPMSVHHALRQLATERSPTAGQFAAHTKRLIELENLLTHHTVKGQQQTDMASNRVQEAQKQVLAGIEQFYSSLISGDLGTMVDVHDATGLEQAFTNLNNTDITESFQSIDAAIKPVRQWVENMKIDLAPHIESTKALHKLASTAQATVLIVEDDEYQHKVLSQILKEENLDLVFATDGIEALAVLRHRRPDLILMDINLPGHDGIEVMCRIKAVERFADIPVIMVTGISAKSVVMDSLKAGAVDFILKPFNKNTLAAKIRKVLNGASR